MTRLALKILLLGALLLAINLALAPLLPYPWGQPPLRAKIDFWRQHADAIDTFFLGSSWTYRQLSPQVFDRAWGRGSRSFNFGAYGVFFPQIPLLLEHFDHQGARPKLWVVELSRMLTAVDPDLGAAREEKYWLSPDTTAAMLRALFERPDKSFPQKLLQGALLAEQLAERAFHLGLGADAGEYWRSPEAEKRWLGPARDGFYPVELQVEEEKGETFANAFLSDPAAARRLAELLEEGREAFANHRWPAPSQEHLREARKLIKKAEARGARLLFLVPPRLGRRYDLLLPVARALPPENVLLELADPRLHPELYDLELTIDYTHLNRRGAELYSRQLAEVLRERGLVVPASR